MPDYTLYNSILKIAQEKSLRFHMPGHKGKKLGTLLDGTYFLDFTEIPPTGNLYSDEDDILSQGEAAAAEYFGCGCCLYLTCGATQGIKAMLNIFAHGESEILADRNTHKSVIDACILLGLYPKYIQPHYDTELGITKDFDLLELDNILTQNPQISVFLITSPTYYGFCLDIKSIKSVCERHKVALLVDAAHGSHLRACGIEDALVQGADCAVFSAHKTLFALTQGAFLLFKDKKYKSSAKKACALFGTTSPSYPIMASLDICRSLLSDADGNIALPAMASCRILRSELTDMGFLCPYLGDPLRITVSCANLDIDGFRLYDIFRQNAIEPEMCDSGNVVFIVTFSDTHEDIMAISKTAADCVCHIQGCEKLQPQLPPMPASVISPRDAFFAKKQRAVLSESLGRAAGENIYIYPPGVPIIAIGEIIDKKSLEYLLNIGYNTDKEIDVISSEA